MKRSGMPGDRRGWVDRVNAHPYLTVFAIAAALRLAWIVMSRPDPFDMVDSAEYHEMAVALLSGEGLITWIGFVRPPAYPIFVAASYALGGIVTLQVLQSILGGLTAALVARLAFLLRGEISSAWLAGLVAAAYPWFFQFVGGLASENVFTPLGVAAFTAIVLAGRTGTPGRSAVAGILFAAASLARANFLTLAPLALIWLASLTRARYGLVFGVSLVAGLVPFAAYNLAQGNGLVIASSGGGLSFFIGNNPDMARLYSGELSDDEWREQNRIAGSGDLALAFAGCSRPQRTEDLCAERASVAERERFFYATSLRYIRERPVEWASTLVHKFVHYWRPWVDPRAYPMGTVIVSGVSFSAVALLALVGLRHVRRRDAALLGLFALGATLTVMLYMVQLRYRYALLDPLLMAFAGIGLSRVMTATRAWTRRARPATSTSRGI